MYFFWTLLIIGILLKPTRLYIILLIFGINYFYTFKLLKKIFFSKDYVRIKINEPIGNLSLFESWLNLSKAEAYIRVYSILKKKKITFYNFILLAIVLLFSIPLKLIITFFTTFKYRKKDNCFYYIHYLHYNNYLNTKIEVINNTRYLNPKFPFFLFFKSTLPYPQQKEFFDQVCEILLKYNDIKNIGEDVLFKRALLKLPNGKIIRTHHYSYEFNGNILHSTSNKPILEPFQLEADEIFPLVLKNANSPCSVITINGSLKNINGFKLVNTMYLNTIFNKNSFIYGSLINKNLNNALIQREEAIEKLYTQWGISKNEPLGKELNYMFNSNVNIPDLLEPPF